MFIEEYLQDLRRERFAPGALVTYVRRVAARVREDLVANPGAVRSAWSVALGFFAAAFVSAGALAWSLDRGLAYDLFLVTALGIVPVFTMVTLNIGLLRDRAGYRLSSLNVPIVLTLVRIVLVPAIVLFVLERRFALALSVYLASALSDVADGWLARRWNQITELGTVFDPVIDIVSNLALFAALAASRLVPTWVFGVAALRYGILLVGGACLHLFVGPVRIRPTWFGRATGVVTSTLVGLLLLLEIVHGTAAARLVPLTRIALGVLLSATVAHVLVLGWYNLKLMTGEAERTGRVVGDVRWGPR